MPDKSPPPLAWSVRVATEAIRFFSLDDDFRAAIRAAQGIEQSEGTLTPFSVMNFMTYLGGEGIETSGRRGFDLDVLLARMADEGVLSSAGNNWSPLFGRRYLLNNALTQAQMSGILWLAPIIGPEIIIDVMAPSIAHITGTSNHEVHGGSGLLIDDCHVLTAAHVVTDITLDETVHFSGAYEAQVEDVIIVDPDRDVALLRVDLPPEVAASRVGGLAFREPRWADRVTVMGYPPVPQTTEAHMTVQTGEVVNPSVETPPMRSVARSLDFLGPQSGADPRGQWFLFSAVARPGNSGGPIIGSDGRVLGLVTREFAEQSGIASPFYAGAPTASIIRALADSKLEGILPIERWS